MDFNTLLDDIYNELEKNKIEKKLVLTPPELDMSTTNTLWKNVKKILKQINRPPDHFINFLNEEIGNANWVSSSKSAGLIIIGKHSKDKINKVLTKYINTYVVCKNCRSTATIITKEKNVKLYKFNCESCNSNYFL